MDLVKLEAEILQTRHDAAYLGDRARVVRQKSSKAAYEQCARILAHDADLLADVERGEILRNRDRMGEVTPL